MRPRLYIHVGMPKTGTTSLQVYCTQQRDWLAQHGVYYPHTMRAPHPTASQHRYLNTALRRASVLSMAEPAQVLCDLAAEIAASGLPAALLSEEQFSYHPWQAAPWLAQLRRWFDVHIVCMVRRADRWVESMYAQAVRGGYRATFAQFLQADATQERLFLRRFLEPWGRAFGASHVHLMAVTAGSCSAALISCLLAIPMSPTAPPRANPSLPGEAIMFLRAMPPLSPAALRGFNQRGARALAALCDPSPYVGLAQADRQALLAAAAGDLDWARGYFSQAPLPPPEPLDLRVTPALSPARRLHLIDALLAPHAVPRGSGTSLPQMEKRLMRL